MILRESVESAVNIFTFAFKAVVTYFNVAAEAPFLVFLIKILILLENLYLDLSGWSCVFLNVAI